MAQPDLALQHAARILAKARRNPAVLSDPGLRERFMELASSMAPANPVLNEVLNSCLLIIHELSEGKQPLDNIYINVVHTVDGTWNLDGRAMTNDEMGQAISQG